MIVYEEKKIGTQSIFIKKILDTTGNTVTSRKVSIPLYNIKKNNFTYILLYDDNSNVIKEAYKFLNYDLYESPLTSRIKAAYALRLLFCFLSLSNIKINEFDETSLRELLFFLRGIDSNPEKHALKTQRSASTINSYLSVYRSFLRYRKIKSKAFFRSYNETSHSIFGENNSYTSKKRYTSNLRTNTSRSDTVPKYIGPNDFKLLYSLAIKDNDITTKLIFHLMYGYGLRLGEVLGVTIEDITEIREDGNYIPVIILRNRLSDRPYQFSKGLPHVTNIKQYKSRDYITTNEKIIITYDLYEELINYVEENHERAMKKYPKNYKDGKADIVSYRNPPDFNHYIFLNRYARPLSDQTWNKNLRKYFKKANISIDYDVRENNLSHRFRHGFAMFHARFSEKPADILSLQKLMRHKVVSSTMIYFNPTAEDELEIKNGFQEELYNMIPELKEGLNVR